MKGLDPVVHGVEVRRMLGVLPTGTFVDPRLTARQNLRFAADLFGLDRSGLDRRIEHALSAFDLLDQADALVAGFSAGMRQRLALARVLLPDPEILLLDEPSAQLDPLAVARLRDLIARLAQESGRTVVLCTHDLHEAQLLCDRVVVLDRGRIARAGSPGELVASSGGRALDVEVDREDSALARSVLDGRLGTTPTRPKGDGPATVDGDVPASSATTAVEAETGKTETREAANGTPISGRSDRHGASIAGRAGADTVILRVQADRSQVPGLVRDLALAGVRVYAVRPHEPSLEEAYLRLYGVTRTPDGGRAFPRSRVVQGER